MSPDLAATMKSGTMKSSNGAPSTPSISNPTRHENAYTSDMRDHVTPSQQLSTLSSRLEDYLQLLDTYTAQRKILATQLSNGYMALSKANFHAGPGRRFGSDWFDSRVRAAMRVTIIQNADDTCELQSIRRSYTTPPRKSLRRNDDGASAGDDSGGEKRNGVADLTEALNTDLAGLAITAEQMQQHTEGSHNEEDQSPAKEALQEHDNDGGEENDGEIILDPLRQFGLLVPQTLRQTQTLFTNAAEIMVRLVTLDAQMRRAEEVIRNIKRENATSKEEKEEHR